MIEPEVAARIVDLLFKSLLIPIVLIIFLLKWRRDKKKRRVKKPLPPGWGRFIKRSAWIIFWIILLWITSLR